MLHSNLNVLPDDSNNISRIIIMRISLRSARVVTCLTPLCFLFCASVWSETLRDLDSHVHGASTLNIIIDADTLFVELKSPWVNLVGFEHQPATQEQLEAMSDAITLLSDPHQFLVFSTDAKCISISSKIDSTVNVVISKDGDSHAEEIHGSQETHSTAQGEDHADDAHHDESHANEERHAEVLASYAFECTQPDTLTELTVRLFSLYPGIEDIDVQMVGPTGQSSLELNSAATTIDLTPVL